MTFDLMALDHDAPKTEFHVNNWGWRPIAQVVLELCPEEPVEGWTYNDGHVVTDERAKEIARRLRSWVKPVELARQAAREKDDAWRAKTPEALVFGETAYWADEEVMEEFIQFCENSGGFEIW